MTRANTTRIDIGDQRGYTMVAAMVFVFIVIMSGMAFFTMSSYETRGAMYRQESSEAFYLADAAVERARAKFLEDRSWRNGWTDAALGQGLYSLTVQDSAYAGFDNAVRLLATGVSGRATRRIEVFADVPPTSFGLAVHILGDAQALGNLCINGNVHVVGDPDFGPNDVRLVCGDPTGEFDLNPPPIFVDPAHFPGATYYYVRGEMDAGVPKARIFDRNMNEITAMVGDDMAAVTTYDAANLAFTFDFDSDFLLSHYFGPTGVFSRDIGDSGVVVNFGEVPMATGLAGKSHVVLDGGATSSIRATIVNTRFTGVTVDQRFDPAYWYGGETIVKQVVLEPDLGISVVAADFMKEGAANVLIGTVDDPAFVYVTNDMEGANANLVATGAITVLGDWSSGGGITINYDVGFLDNVPPYLYETWPGNVAGTLKVLSWREY